MRAARLVAYTLVGCVLVALFLVLLAAFGFIHEAAIYVAIYVSLSNPYVLVVLGVVLLVVLARTKMARACARYISSLLRNPSSTVQRTGKQVRRIPWSWAMAAIGWVYIGVAGLWLYSFGSQRELDKWYARYGIETVIAIGVVAVVVWIARGRWLSKHLANK